MYLNLSSFSFKNSFLITLMLVLMLIGLKLLEPALIEEPTYTPTYTEQFEVKRISLDNPIIGLNEQPKEIEMIEIKRGNSNMHKRIK